MKKLLLTLVAGLMACAVTARAESAWGTDLTTALAAAKKAKQHVLLDFTGSDWCPPCKKLKADVFDSKEFADYAGKNFKLVEVDFPRTKKLPAERAKANGALQSKYNIEGYPTVIVLNGEGKEVWRNVGYLPGGPKVWIEKFDEARKK